jgi:hypothetical protein
VFDTQLIKALSLPAERFFAAKMRLVTASVIRLHVDLMARPLIELLQPERPNPKSHRYVMLVTPLELYNELRKQIFAYRIGKRKEKLGSQVPTEAQQQALLKRAALLEKRKQKQVKSGLPRLGVQPVLRQPVRPPIAKHADFNKQGS